MNTQRFGDVNSPGFFGEVDNPGFGEVGFPGFGDVPFPGDIQNPGSRAGEVDCPGFGDIPGSGNK